MGMTYQEFNQLINITNIHHRCIIQEPVHLPYESIYKYFQIYYFDPSWITLQNAFARLDTTSYIRRNSLRGCMATQSQDIYALIPDYPPPEMVPPTDIHL